MFFVLLQPAVHKQTFNICSDLSMEGTLLQKVDTDIFPLHIFLPIQL